jgi:DNA-binding NarL/FixJ family response regulator
LDQQPDLVVCGEAATAAAALDQVVEAQPDLVLIDISLPDMNGIALARILRERHPALPLAMLTGHRGRRYVEQALAAGVRGYILKGQAHLLPLAIRQLVQGEPYLSAEIQRWFSDRESNA